MTENTYVQLNQVVGYHLLNFLDGTDVTNFIEAVNTSSQFWSIAKTLDHHFVELIKMFQGHRRIYLPRALFDCGTDEYQIDDEQFMITSQHYSSVAEPLERIFIHPCFSNEGFLKLCAVYQTPLFQCYSRLLPLNSAWYNADFGLLDYETYGHTVGSERMLNIHEKKLLRVSTYFRTKDGGSPRSNLTFVHNINEFRKNLAIRFSTSRWIEAIDFSKLALVGGCVLNALCQSPFPDTKEQDINLIYYADDVSNFRNTVEATVTSLNKIVSRDVANGINVEKIPGSPSYNIFLPCGVRLNISWPPVANATNLLSHILHNFDMDICQVAFTGDKIVSTFSFLQALATKTFICYTLHAQTPKHVCTRIEKYCNRGFDLLEPLGFDGDFDILMGQEEIPLYRVEHQPYMDDDGEIQIAIKKFRRMPARNIDTYRLQEKFIRMVCPELMQYK